MEKYFIAIDEIQILTRPEWAGLYCKNQVTGKVISFARFFTWTNENHLSQTVISTRRIDSMVSSLMMENDEVRVDIITEFEILSESDARKTFEKVCSSAETVFPFKSRAFPSQQVFWKLQGRPNILMRFIEELVEDNGLNTPDEVFDKFEKYACSPSKGHRAFNSYGDLWVRFLSDTDKTVSFSMNNNIIQTDTLCNFMLKALMQSVQIRREDETWPFESVPFIVEDSQIPYWPKFSKGQMSVTRYVSHFC
jgi:hypothetical protein